MTYRELDQMIDTATGHLSARQHYAIDVICGYQRWSGADLKGAAKKWGASYAQQRKTAHASIKRAGGCVVITRRHGKRLTAICVGQDDYGDAIYQTTDGPILGVELRAAQ